jgi:hypothetical protein
MSQNLVFFSGADSSAGPVLIGPASMNGNFLANAKILSVVAMPPVSADPDWATVFAPTSLSGYVIQVQGHNFSGRTFLALLST